MIRSLRGAAVVLTAALAFAAPASAAPSVTVTSASRSGDAATVTGTVDFPAITAPQSVVGEGASRSSGAVGGSPAGNAAGLQLTDATIVPLADGSGLRFTWVVASLPEQVPPEGVRYNWAFRIGSRTYQLQAKRTNLVNATTVEDPVGHVQHAQKQENFFQLRGACTTAYLGTPVNGCYHLAFLKGRFDTAAKTISIDLPYETRDAIGRLVAPDFKPGAVLVDNGGDGSAGMVIAASFQAVVSNTIVSQYINGISPYYVGPQVSLGVGPANADPAFVEYTTPATVTGSTFSGTVTGLSTTDTTVFVRACNGTECAYATQPAGA